MQPPVSLEDYRVELDAYAGPLDLLLYLVKRHEIDLHDIPIAKLTEQYLEHLKLIEQIDVDLAGEFLVMAATLLEIKSAMLLPRAEEPGAGAGGDVGPRPETLDPRYELVQQLLAYKRFKDAANDLEARREEWEARFPRQPGRPASADAAKRTLAEIEAAAGEVAADEVESAAPVEIDLGDVNVLDLCEAFARILESIGHPGEHKVVYDDTPVALHAEDILDRLQRDTESPASGGAAGKRSLTLQEIFVGRASRSEMIGLFLATLELVRQKRVRVVQEKIGGEIRLELRAPAETAAPEDDRPADWRDPKTGEMQYEWPSEEARRAAERRAKLRAAYAAKRRPGAAGAAADEGPADDEIVDVDGEGEPDMAERPGDADDPDPEARRDEGETPSESPV